MTKIRGIFIVYIYKAKVIIIYCVACRFGSIIFYKNSTKAGREKWK